MPKSPALKKGTKVRVCIGHVEDGDRGRVALWRDATLTDDVAEGARPNAIIATKKDDPRDAHLLGPAAKLGHYEVRNLDHVSTREQGPGANHALAWRTVEEDAAAAKAPKAAPGPKSSPPAAPPAPPTPSPVAAAPAAKPPPPSVVRTPPPAPPPTPAPEASDAPPADADDVGGLPLGDDAPPRADEPSNPS